MWVGNQKSIFRRVLGGVDHVRGVDEVLAGQIGDVRTRAAEVMALDERASPRKFSGKRPGKVFPCFAGAEDEKVVVVGILRCCCHFEDVGCAVSDDGLENKEGLFILRRVGVVMEIWKRSNSSSKVV